MGGVRFIVREYLNEWLYLPMDGGDGPHSGSNPLPVNKTSNPLPLNKRLYLNMDGGNGPHSGSNPLPVNQTYNPSPVHKMYYGVPVDHTFDPVKFEEAKRLALIFEEERFRINFQAERNKFIADFFKDCPPHHSFTPEQSARLKENLIKSH